jgi:UPF0271 protein
MTIVLDTSAFIQGFDTYESDLFTVPKVLEEVKDRNALMRLESWIEIGKLHVLKPEHRFSIEVENMAVKMGEAKALSLTDKELLALGLQLKFENYKPEIISDDYSVQNMADALGIKHVGLATPGIKKRLTWTIYCPGCRRTFSEPQTDGVCPICGTILRRKPNKQKKRHRLL